MRKLATRIRKEISRWLPQPLKHQLRYGFNLSLDGVDVVLGRRQKLVAPRRVSLVESEIS